MRTPLQNRDSPSGGTWLAALLLSTLRLIPVVVMSVAAWPLANLWLRVLMSGRSRRLMQTNIEKVWNLPGHSWFARALATQALYHQIITAIESIGFLLRRSLWNSGIVDDSDLAAVARDLPSGPVIIISGHVGAWELGAFFGAKWLGRRFNVLAKPAKFHFVNAALETLRGAGGARVLWTGRQSILKDMIGVLRSGEALGFVMDQKPDNRRGVSLPFLGHPTEFVNGPAAMAMRFQCPIISIFCVRTGPMRYRIVSRRIHLPKDAHEAAVTVLMAGELERVVRLYPEQWTWNYRRWRWE